MSNNELFGSIKDRMEKARALAITLGDIIGKVSRNISNKVQENEYIVNVIVDPLTYYKYNFLGKVGIFLGVIDIKTLYFILLRVIGYERSDVSSYLFDNSTISTIEDEENPGTLINNVIIKCEMLTKVDILSSSDIAPGDIIIEPQSPVIIPRAEIIERALGINNGALKIGFLDLEEANVKVSLSLDELNYHTLILGTTGAGKTSFIKDLLSALYKIDEEGSKVFVVDTTGDYYHMFLPPQITNKQVKAGIEKFEELYGKMNNINIDIIYPITRKWAKKYLKNNYGIENITTQYYNLYVSPLIQYLNKEGIKTYTSILNNEITISNSFWTSKISINPFYFKFKNVKKILYRLNPYFSEQASHFLKIILSQKEFSESYSLNNFIDRLDDNIFEKMKLHRSTRENIIRGLYLLRETDMFDLKIEQKNISKLLESDSKITIFDLYNSELDDFTQKIFIYYILDKIFSIREKQLRSGIVKGRYLIVLDEAHRFFPSTQGSEEDTYYVRRVAGKISTMMRLGRRRKIGFIFATHNPADLSDIIVQLSNTKIIFRIRPEISETFGLTKMEAKTLSWENNGVAFIISPWLREGKIKIRVPVPPPVGHYDLSKT
jgi:DNA helicase HerA-like ATPase